MPYSADLDNVINGLSEIENLLEARLRQINTAVKLNGALNRHSINTDIEVFFAEFLNILFDWDLIEANFSGHNEPGIDLVSDKDKVVVQVSSSANSAKVKESLRKTPKVYKKNGYHFYFVTTALNLPPYKAKFDNFTEGLVFNHEKDIFDMRKLLDEARDPQKARQLSELVDSFFARRQKKKQLGLCPLGDWNEDSINIFTFNSGSVKLFGRDDEMELLRRFANSEYSFRWFAIAAQWGIGKTRLAYELQNELLNTGEWDCVELKGNEVWSNLSELNELYPRKTLFIADYVAPHTQELGKWMKELSQPTFRRRNPIRLLLLERDTNDVSWFESLIGADSYNIKRTGPHSPFILSPISDKLPDLILDFASYVEQESMANCEATIPLPKEAEKRILERLKSIDHGFERPLFAMMLTYAWLRSEEAQEWGEDKLLTDIVDREIAFLERRLEDYHSYDNRTLPKSCIFFWTIATVKGVVGNCNAQKLLQCSKQDEDVLKRHAKQHEAALIDGDIEPHFVLLQKVGLYEKGCFLPMLPDILGEFFVLKEMGTMNDESLAKFWSVVLDEDASAFKFFSRMLKDFGMLMKKDDELRMRVFPENLGLSLENARSYKLLLEQLFKEHQGQAVEEVLNKSLRALTSQQTEVLTDNRIILDVNSLLPVNEY